MKILILNWRDVSHPLSGGAEIVTMEHAKAWVRMGHAVTWLTAGYAKAPPDETIDGVTFIRRAGSFTIYLYTPLFVLLYGRQFDVIVDEAHGFPFFAPFFTRTPVVMFIHEIAGEIWDYMFPFPKNIIGKFLEHYYFYLYKHYYFWTDAPSTVEELTARGIPKKQCIAIPCPIIPMEQLRITNYELCKQQKENNPTFLFVSRVVKMKGIEEVIKAFSFIAKEQKNVKLWIVGSGDREYINRLKEMLEDYHVKEKVWFWGKMSEKKKFELMARAHILLHASVKEGWGLVVLEAASVGTPSIVYNVSGLRDVVRNGKTGIVLSENSPKEMAKEAMLLIQNTNIYRKLQSQGLEWVKSLKWSTVTKQSAKLLEKAITSAHEHS